MSTNYQIERIISEQERVELLDYFHTLPPQLAHQDYNLFDVDKRDVRGEWPAPIHKITKYGKDLGHTPHTHYFLKYEEDAFTRMHTDDDKVIKLTIITMIETDNLVGGGTLVFDKYNRKARPAHKYAKRTDNDTPGPYGKDIIPVIVESNDGESVIYDGKTQHAVTQVKQGHRIVLVSWFK